MSDHHHEEEEEKKEDSFLCTIAVTGANPRYYQSIFVCRDCAPSEEMQCVCEGCAEACHENHNVEYIGMGPSYCDCGNNDNNCCKIQDKSRNKALEMKCADCFSNAIKAPPVVQVFDAQTFQCKQLESQETCERLITQIKTLVRHSRATFWIDASASPDDLCELEQLALQIFQRHTASSTVVLEENNNSMVGAEWWVQVKDVTTTTSNAAAVDLHYDKDEDLADAFGLGYFPLLSTVTYLTEQSYPTLVFPHSYDDPEDEDMASMLVSHPRRGKHLVFDGRLLHGVPANPALLQSTTTSEPPSGTRVTFLVNLWQKTKPSGIHVLEESIRDAIKRSVASSENDEAPLPLVVDMQETTILPLELKSEDDLPEESRHRLELPFVSKGATWVGDDDDDDDSPNLVVLTFPAPRHESDTVNVRFENGLQAYLDYQTDADDEDGEATGPYEEGYV